VLPLVFYEVQLAVPTDISSKSDPLGLSRTTKCVDELMDLQGYNMRPASSFFPVGPVAAKRRKCWESETVLERGRVRDRVAPPTSGARCSTLG